MKRHISSTSALVLLLSMNGVHTSKAAKRYLGLLDMESGKDLFAKCIGFWPHYTEVIKNRKSCILQMTKDAVRDGTRQVVIFGAGLDALSVEAASRFEDCRFFELDMANMDEKNRLLRSADPQIAERIRCIHLDISGSDGIMTALSENGWDADSPTLAVFEGISYYLSCDKLWSVIGAFATPSRQNRVILEYFVSNGEIQPERIPIAEYPFNLIASESGLDGIERYGTKDVVRFVEGISGRMLHNYGMMEMERSRTLKNEIFDTERSGWIRVCHFAI